MTHWGHKSDEDYEHRHKVCMKDFLYVNSYKHGDGEESVGYRVI